MLVSDFLALEINRIEEYAIHRADSPIIEEYSREEVLSEFGDEDLAGWSVSADINGADEAFPVIEIFF